MLTVLRGSNTNRNTGIDLFRGLLVLAVILGHFDDVTQGASFLNWIGHGFRMPLFLGLTGYMFNLDRARSAAVSTLFQKYYARLILPWLVACAVYLTITQQLGYLSPLYIFVRPPFHLWFVPVMMVFILTATVSRRSATAMLAIAVPASIGAMYVFGVGHIIEQFHSWTPDRRFFVYPIYFFLGLWVARHPPERRQQRAALLLVPIGLLWWCGLYNQLRPLAEVAANLTLCVPLIILLPMVRTISFNIPLVASIGRESLFFYLWHPMVFGLWESCHVFRLPMLLFSLLTLIVARAVLVRIPDVAGILGISPRNLPVRLAFPEAAAPG